MTWGRSENFIYFIKQCIYRFVITGSHYHFWFFPALIFSICISTLLFKIKCKNILIPLSIGLYMVGCLGCSYYGIGIKIPVIQDLINSSYFEIVRRVMLMGFPFFICGYLVYKIQYNFLTGENKSTSLVWIRIIAVVIWLMEIYIVQKLKWADNIIITFGLYFLVIITLWQLIRNPLYKSNKIADKYRVLANFTYYSHPLLITGISFLASNMFNLNISATLLFVLVLIITYMSGNLIYKLNNKYINQIVK